MKLGLKLCGVALLTVHVLGCHKATSGVVHQIAIGGTNQVAATITLPSDWKLNREPGAEAGAMKFDTGRLTFSKEGARLSLRTVSIGSSQFSSEKMRSSFATAQYPDRNEEFTANGHQIFLTTGPMKGRDGFNFIGVGTVISKKSVAIVSYNLMDKAQLSEIKDALGSIDFTE